MIIDVVFFFIIGIVAGEAIKDVVEPEPWQPDITVLYENDPYLSSDASYPIDLNL